MLAFSATATLAHAAGGRVVLRSAVRQAVPHLRRARLPALLLRLANLRPQLAQAPHLLWRGHLCKERVVLQLLAPLNAEEVVGAIAFNVAFLLP